MPVAAAPSQPATGAAFSAADLTDPFGPGIEPDMMQAAGMLQHLTPVWPTEQDWAAASFVTGVQTRAEPAADLPQWRHKLRTLLHNVTTEGGLDWVPQSQHQFAQLATQCATQTA